MNRLSGYLGMQRSSNNSRCESRRERLGCPKVKLKSELTVPMQRSGRVLQCDTKVERLGKEGDRTTPSRDPLPLSKELGLSSGLPVMLNNGQ